MSDRDDRIRGLLDAYLDGELDGPDLRAVEEGLERDPALRAEADCQARIDAALARLFATPPIPARLERWLDGASSGGGSGECEGAGEGTPARRRRAWAIGAIATAAAVLIAAGAWWTLEADTTLDRLYSLQVRNAWTPLEVCTTPEAFESWVERYYGVPLRPDAGAKHRIEFIGWRYNTTLSGMTGVLLARADSEPLLVLVDRAENDRPLAPPRRHDHLRLHRREVSGLVLYELSPFDSPRVLDSLASAR